VQDRPDDLVITGIGIVSPVGGDAPSTMKSMLDGKSGVALLPEAQRAGTPVHLQAPVADTAFTRTTAAERRRYDRSVNLALQAAREAWEDAGRPAAEPARFASVMATGVGGLLTIYDSYSHYLRKGFTGLPAFTIPGLISNTSAALVAAEYGAHAGAIALSSACASSADAVAYALRLFRLDEIDIAVVGGTEAVVHPMTLSGFSALRALSNRNDDPTRASRPFDRDRDGFVLGEGAAVMVIERSRHAAARGARAWGRLLGAGATCDAANLVAPDPDGTWSAEAMLKALSYADIAPSDVAFISAHATSTVNGDTAEYHALRRAFGASLDDMCITAVKSAMGHLLGAASAVAIALAAMSLHEGLVPPTQNLDNLDSQIDLDVVSGSPRKISLGAALINSAGFGGHNVAVVVGPE
jgi:3-oxoacyl-[acyl-carrier-protein] synthase II